MELCRTKLIGHDKKRRQSESLNDDLSNQRHEDWQNGPEPCQPNFWRNVSPDPKTSCGPYEGFLNILFSKITSCLFKQI